MRQYPDPRYERPLETVSDVSASGASVFLIEDTNTARVLFKDSHFADHRRIWNEFSRDRGTLVKLRDGRTDGRMRWRKGGNFEGIILSSLISVNWDLIPFGASFVEKKQTEL